MPVSHRDIAVIVVTALLTAAGTYTANHFFEGHKRRLDRKALAASLLAEVDTVLKLFMHLGIEQIYRDAQNEMKRRLKASDADLWPTLPNNVLSFPVTVYEKCADRIGTLGPDVAGEVVYFYNFLNGLRINVKMATSDSGIPLPVRAEYNGKVADMITNERPRLLGLPAKLLRIVRG
jgi:succinate dehydrogenase flavin-adding protein (antitoxin of CptAB toxin-antitoxin module)